MLPIRPGIRRLFRLDAWRRGDTVRDVDDEVQLHVDLRTSQLIADGLDPVAAAAEARRLFAQRAAVIGALYSTADGRNQQMRLQRRWESLGQDLRYVARRLTREPVVTAFLILTLAFGIGANVTAFSLVDRVLLRGPAHLVNPAGLTRLYIRTERPPMGVQTSAWIPYFTFLGLRKSMRGVEALGAYRVDDAMVGAGVNARRMRVGTADGDMFRLLGVRPLRGRLFAPGEDAAAVGDLAVVGEAFWRAELNADPAVVGRTVVIKEIPRIIVGVAPEGFSGPALGRVDAWTLIDSRQAKFNNWNVVGRLAPGTSIATADREAEAAHQRTLDEGPKWSRDAKIIATQIGYDDNARESMEAIMSRWLAAVSAIILLITCANVVNLQLARLARRRQELGIRVALGAGRSRIVRLLILEGALLGLGGGVASLLVAQLMEPVIRRSLFQDASWKFSLTDSHILLAVGAVTFLTTLAISVVPAIQLGRGSLTASLRSGTRVGGARTHVRQALTILQASLSVLLLVGAGLFLRSLGRMQSIDLGMNPDRVTTADVTFLQVNGTPAERIAFMNSPEHLVFEREHYGRLREAVSHVAGVESAALTIGLPFYGSFGVGLWLPGLDSIPVLPGGGPYITAVGEGYFTTIGTRLIRGRLFSAQDGVGTAPVVIVAASMARLLWPRGDAVGSCLTIFERGAPCARIVGVVADIHRTGFREEPSLQYYVPMGQQRGFDGVSLLIRSASGASPSAAAIRRALLNADPAVSAVDLRLLSDALNAEVRPVRLGIVTFSLSGALALLVAALGLYSLMSYMVAWRTHELGVRMAMGATEWQVARLVVGGGVALTAIGVAIGLGLSVAARPWVQPQLFETSASDPVVLVGVAASLLLVSLLAGFIPARRAARISPTEALRSD